jgi:iron complex outermembrane recepter protein
VFRNPTAEQRAFYCNKATFVDTGSGDCLTGDIAAIVDVRKNNTAIVETNGIDVLANYDFENTAGAFSTGLNATYLRTFAQAQRPSSALIDLIDTPNNPLKLKIRGSVSWARNSFGTTASLNFTDDYVDTITEPNRPIGSWTTLDLQFTYAWAADRTWLEGTTLALSVLNVFDKMPPFVNNATGVGFDTTNADLRGRFAALTFRKKW